MLDSDEEERTLAPSHFYEGAPLQQGLPVPPPGGVSADEGAQAAALAMIPRPIMGTHQDDVDIPLHCQLNSYTRNGLVFLDIMKKPERRHRARYKTESSRGVVKDITGFAHPIVRLCGYNMPAKLRVFIGTGSGDVAPHPYYQATNTRIRSSTACVMKVIDKTVVLEMDMLPGKNMIVICDCIGIVKQRNADVQQRLEQSNMPIPTARKKSSNVRLVFRTTIRHPDLSFETIQITSESIDCIAELRKEERRKLYGMEDLKDFIIDFSRL